MFLRPLSFIFGASVCMLLITCGGSEDEGPITDNIPLKNQWTDSIFGSLTEEQQFNQHLIIEVPPYYQSNVDSLSSWVQQTQPGGLRFIDWNPDTISMLKNSLDTLNLIQPFIYCDYFDFLGIPQYPYWESNEANQDLNLTNVFAKSGMNLVDFEYNVKMNPETVGWLDTLKSQQAIYPIAAHFDDSNIKNDFNDFMLAIQRYNHNVKVKIGTYDTVRFEKFRQSSGFGGLFIVETKTGSINKLLEGGVDMAFKKIETNEVYSKWNGGTEEFTNSTKRILDYKSKVRKSSKAAHLDSDIKYTSLNLLHNSASVISDKSKMLPFSARFTLYAEESIGISTKVRKDVGVTYNKSKLDKKSLKKIAEKNGNKVIILSDSINTEALSFLNGLNKSANTLVCFQNPAHYSQLKKSANLLFIPGFAKQSGDIFVQQLSKRLTMNGNFVLGDSIIDGKRLRKTLLARTVPEYIGYDTDTLNRINWAVKNAMNGRAFPGCQVLLAKNGCIVYDKQFGHHSYKRQKVVTNESMYDLASLTKVVATTLVGMKLWEMGKYAMQDSLVDFLPDSLKNYLPYPSTIRNITFHELFIHKSGLPAGFPLIRYLTYTSESVGRFDKYFCDINDTAYCIEVAQDFFMEREYGDSMWLKLNQMWLDKSKPYKYSDVNMNTLYYMFKGMIENAPRDYGFTEPAKKLVDKDLFVEYLYKTFYKPLGMDRSKYKPLKHYSQNSIVPTEDEAYWRKQLLQGHVHDPNAALMGGIGGNAGIFSTTNDLAKLCQMLLDKGVYNDKRFLNAATVEKFTSVAENSHRGLGFNKRTISTTGFGMADSSSIDTYGHTGFTGTCIWIDPQEDLVYIFLSNRVHPKVNNRIYQFGIRKRVHNAAYEARLNL